MSDPIRWACLAASAISCACGETPAGDVQVGEGPGSARVERAEFDVVVSLADGTMWSAPASDDPALGLLSFGVVGGLNPARYYDPMEAEPRQWFRPGRVLWARIERDGGGAATRARLRVAVPPEVGAGLTVDLEWTCRDAGGAREVCGTEVDVAVEDPGEIAFTRLSWSLRPGEALYGLGERFGHPDLRGRKHAMQMEVGGTASGLNEVHAPVPWVVSTRGYAVLIDDVRPGAMDLGAGDPDAATATYASAGLSFVVLTARDPWTLAGEIVRRTGAPRVPPMWAFGPQMWRNELEDRAELLADARAIRDHDLPVSVLWIDNPWQTAYNDFTFNPVQFPDAPSMIAELHDRGFRVLVWSTPYLDVSDDSHVREGMNHDTGGLYEEAQRAGYLVRGAGGPVVLFPWTSGKNGAMIDFTNPDASEWWTETARRATGIGIDGFKLDYGELSPHLFGSRLQLAFADGTSEIERHAYYSVLYHRAYREALRRDRPAGFVIGRASTLGGQADVDCIWPGDLDNDFADHREIDAGGDPAVGGLPAAVHALQSLSVSGFPSFGSDTGGYRGGAPTSEVLVRWAAHTAFTPIMQVGGAGENHNPWDSTLYPEPWVVPAMRKFMKTHQQLVPYLYALVRRAAIDALPPVMPIGLVHPDDAAAREEGCAYYLGERMLVAPACRGENPRQVHLPAGTWVDWWTGDVRSGPSDVAMPNPLHSIPVFLAPGAVVPLFPPDVDTMVPTADPEAVYVWESDGALVFRVVPAEAGDPGEWEVFGPDGETRDAYVSVARVGECQRFDETPAVPSSAFGATVLEVDWNVFSDGAPSSAGGFTEAASLVDVLDGCDRCWYYDASNGKVYASPIPDSICR